MNASELLQEVSPIYQDMCRRAQRTGDIELRKITVKKFDHIDRTDIDSLLDSVIRQNTSLDSGFLQKNMERFEAAMNRDYEE